jgi:hypothetical protein
VTFKKKFRSLFPNLKIEFYKELHSEGESSEKNHIKNDDLTILQIMKKPSEQSITITPKMTVNKLESVFAQKFKIGAQVFRRS